MSTTVRDNADAHRYELVDGDHVLGFADYVVQADRVVLPHTVIEPGHRGQGLGAILVRGALDRIREDGRHVEPQCWYVAEFVRAHPEYHDLVEDA